MSAPAIGEPQVARHRVPLGVARAVVVVAAGVGIASNQNRAERFHLP